MIKQSKSRQIEVSRKSNWPLVSVIIPVFNRHKTINLAIDSIDYPNHEVIVVDDGSTPPLTSVVDFSRWDCLKLIRQKNKGASGARNAATAAARGAYIAYLDSDDIYVSGKIQRMVTLLEQNPDIDFSFHDISRFKYRLGTIKPLDKLHSDFFPGITKECLNSRRLSGKVEAYRIPSVIAFGLLTSGSAIFPSSVVLRLTLAKKVGLWDETRPNCNDMDFFSRALLLSDAIYAPEPLTRMGVGDDNISMDSFRQLVSDTEILARLESLPLSHAHRRALNLAIYLRNSALGWQYKKKNDFLRARAAYQTALQHKKNLKSIMNFLYLSIKICTKPNL